MEFKKKLSAEGFGNKEKYIKLAIIAGLIILSDQISKAVILNTLSLYDSVAVIPGFFSITHIHNPGGVFGVFADQSALVRKLLFLVVSTFAAGFVLYFYHKIPRTHSLLASAFALIFGGAIGNLIDRIYLGKVVDFLDFHIGSWHWPAFNIADSAISIGVIIFLFHILLDKIPE